MTPPSESARVVTPPSGESVRVVTPASESARVVAPPSESARRHTCTAGLDLTVLASTDHRSERAPSSTGLMCASSSKSEKRFFTATPCVRVGARVGTSVCFGAG
jgi:hypothetical protein